MKKSIVLTVLLFAFFTVNAQKKKQNIYLIDKKGLIAKTKDSAEFIRIIQEPDSGETNFVLYEFYMDDKRKKLGKVSSFDPYLVFEGNVISYDRNGVKTSAVNYKNGARSGAAYYYYTNGKMKKQAIYTSEKLKSDKEKVIYLADSLGNVMVKEGNGHWIEKSMVGKSQLIEEGDYKDGFKDGLWKGQYVGDKKEYIDTFAMGKFISGETIVDGQKYTYTEIEQPPVFKRGPADWLDFVARNTKYPVQAFQNDITGTVYTSFTIEKDGSISEIKIDKSVHPILDEEAKRMIGSAPKWTPGKLRGVPVRVKFTQKVSFKTNY